MHNREPGEELTNGSLSVLEVVGCAVLQEVGGLGGHAVQHQVQTARVADGQRSAVSPPPPHPLLLALAPHRRSACVTDCSWSTLASAASTHLGPPWHIMPWHIMLWHIMFWHIMLSSTAVQLACYVEDMCLE